jgi:hypothetical protein
MEPRRIRLPGDRLLTVRPIQDTDLAGLKALFDGLGDEDLYRRFFSAHPPPDRFLGQMTTVTQRGGFGVVATIDGPGVTARLVAEAGYALLPDGDAELGITVAGPARGWLGPFLLDLLVEEAASHGIANLQAEVLLTNRRMMSLLESRGLAVIDNYDSPAILRVCIGTTGRTPAWSDHSPAPRLLVEVPSGRWRITDAARAAGFQVLLCPGRRSPLAPCPAATGRPCPLAAAADVIVEGVSGDAGERLLNAHRALHPGVPICLDWATDPDSAGGEHHIGRAMPGGEVLALLERLSGRPPGAVPAVDGSASEATIR